MSRLSIFLIIAVLLLSSAHAIEVKENAIMGSSSELGFIQNNSSLTLCTEDDNINIPIYYRNLTKFRIVAAHPTYLPTDVTDGGKNCSNCRCIDRAIMPKKIYDDGNVIIETVRETPWWRNGESMNVSVKGGNSSSDATYVRIYNKTLDIIDYPQVFVLYEDGNARVIPQPPLDLKKVTFGSSVIIGPTENHTGHFTGIDYVKIDPLNLAMDIMYEDKTTAHVELQANRNKNIVEVSNITYDTYNHPFASLRSMWVKDGNADADHIRTDEGEFPIMGKWTKLEGTWWEFFRKVPSIHNTYGPDIRIEVIF